MASPNSYLLPLTFLAVCLHILKADHISLFLHDNIQLNVCEDRCWGEIKLFDSQLKAQLGVFDCVQFGTGAMMWKSGDKVFWNTQSQTRQELQSWLAEIAVFLFIVWMWCVQCSNCRGCYWKLTHTHVAIILFCFYRAQWLCGMAQCSQSVGGYIYIKWSY